MERVSCWTMTNSAYVFVLLRVRLNLKMLSIGIWRSMSSQCAIFPSKHTIYNGLFVHWLNAWNGYRVGPGRSDCTFALLHVRLNLKVLLVFNECIVRSYSYPPDMLFKYTILAMTTKSAFVECYMGRLLRWSLTNRPYVYIA